MEGVLIARLPKDIHTSQLDRTKMGRAREIDGSLTLHIRREQ